MQKKYPIGGLSIFNDPSNMDPKDYQICACNMPDYNYNQLEKSVKNKISGLDLDSISPNCLLPACMVSKFKYGSLEKCPIPLCLQYVTVDENNNVINIATNNDQNCKKFGIEPLGYVPTKNKSISHFTLLNSNRSNNNIWLILIILIFVIFLILICCCRKKNNLMI